MKFRYWLLLIGSVLALIGLYGNELPWWRDWCLIFGGALIGAWALEGEREHQRERGIDMEPW